MATNTVPIEIVLQDPNNPIVPTPDNPSDNPGENTNISVPDTALGTGYTTKDGSGAGNIFTGSSATVSIASIVVLVLALGAIVALLVRRYQKHKKSAENKEAKVSKGERLATAATATLAVLAATVLVGQLLMTTTNAATANEGTVLSTPDKIQIIANRYDDVTIVASTKAVSYATTDTSFGYKIFMSMAGDNANLYLDGDTSSEHYFAPTENAGLDDNSWGYSLTGKANYTAMPLEDDALMAQQNTSAVSDEEFIVYYTMKADKDMPFGVYSGEISYDIEGQVDFPVSLTTMQGMTSEICDATYTPNAFKADGVTIEDNVPTKTLTDTRDGKTYTVAKLADGKCWMVQNLDLQKEGLTVALDSTNTDHPANGFTLPASQTSSRDSWGDPNAVTQTDVETPHVYSIDQKTEDPYRYCLKYQGNCPEWGDVIPEKELGNLYNWYTATAGTGKYNTSSDDDKEATGSICPAGWRLPSSSNNYEATDYSGLLYLYGITQSPTSSNYINTDKTAIYKAPLSLVPTGWYHDGLNDVGMAGQLSLPLASGNSGDYVINFAFSSNYVNPWNGFRYKIDGFAVRCLAR